MFSIYRPLFFLVAFFAALVSYAQSDTSYYDLKWRTANKGNASYYRTAVKLADSMYEVDDHFLNNKIQMSGRYSVLGTNEGGVKDGHFIYYDSVGNKKSEGAYVKNKRDGVWTSYFAGSNTVKSKVSNKNGMRDGYGVAYDSMLPDKILNEGNWVANSKDGLWKYYYKGFVVSELNYKNGERYGKAIYYDSNTHTKASEGEYQLNKRVGSWNFYYRGGQKIAATRNFAEGLEISFTEYYDNGSKSREGSFSEKRPAGLWRYYNTDGTDRGLVDYEKGKLVFYDSVAPRLKVKGNLKNGMRDGLWQFFYPSGDILLEEQYKEGIMDGGFVRYDSVGYKKLIGAFENGKRSGIWKYYFAGSKTVWVQSEYENDSLNGKVYSYYRDGNAKGKEVYRHGERESGVCYRPDGTEMQCLPLIKRAGFKGDVAIYIGKHLVYPENAKAARIEGEVLVAFDVNADGSISNVYVVKGIGHGCDEEAKRVVEEMPNWIPEQVDGRVFQTYNILPISFRLDKNENVKSGWKGVEEKSSNSLSPNTAQREVFTYVEQMPRFDGNVNQYLSANIVYPEDARKNNIEGKVILNFVIDEEGVVDEVTVVRGIGGGCDEEAKRVVQSMPKWIAGKQNGRPVKVRFTLPILFKLTEPENGGGRKK